MKLDEDRGAAWCRFADYALARLPPPPARVLEVGCGEEGGIARVLSDAGYEVLAIDPLAPEGPLYRRTTLEELDDPGPFHAAVAGRVLHHVTPLEPALDKLVSLAPLLVLDEFAHDLIDESAYRWYAEEYRRVSTPGGHPHAPSDLRDWRARHSELHPHTTLLSALDARYETRDLRFGPYFYRWLRDDRTRAREERALEEGVLRPIGYRYTGVARSP